MNYACIKLIDASVLLYFSFDSSFSQSRSMGQAVLTVHLTFYRLAAVIRDMSDIHRYSDHSLFFISTIVYTIALEAAPFGLALNSQFFRPTVNGLIAFSLRLLDKLQ